MRQTTYSLCFLWLFCLTSSAFAEDQSPATDSVEHADLFTKVKQAYQAVDTYDAVLHFRMEHQQGRWNNIQEADFYVRLDRSTGQCYIDKPEMVVLFEGERLRMKSEDLGKRYLDMTLAQGAEWSNVLSEIPMLRQPALIDVAFFLSNDPIHIITGESNIRITELEPVADDPKHQPRLAARTPEGTFILWIDPERYCITQALFDYDTSGMQGTQTDRLQLWFYYDIQVWDEAIDAERFAFDIEGYTAYASMPELMRVERTQAAAPSTRGPSNPHIGKQSPDFETITTRIEPFKLSKVDEPIIVLDFWTTWAQHSDPSLKQLQQVIDWIEEDDLPVAVYAINVGETVQDALRYLEQREELVLQVLVDPEHDIVEMYGVTSVPATVIISQGKVEEIYIGYAEDKADILRKDIESLMKAIDP